MSPTNRSVAVALLALSIGTLAACGEREPPVPPTSEEVAPVTGDARSTDTPPVAVQPMAPESPATAPPTPAADAWLGEWRGPEGTMLRLGGGAGAYEIAITNLDGERTFTGTAQGDGISFERDGVAESIRAGSGADTGMKWLADKRDCLVVRSGEGYCRD